MGDELGDDNADRVRAIKGDRGGDRRQRWTPIRHGGDVARDGEVERPALAATTASPLMRHHVTAAL
jgi:hypothetical protein